MDVKILTNSFSINILESISNKIFLQFEAVLCKDIPNLNNYHFHESFIDEIVTNKSYYIGLPIKCGLEELMSRDFFNLRHKQSPILNKFYTQTIGSYVDFRKEYDDNGVATLIGAGRISKCGNEDLIEVLMELYNSPIGLNFSVEVEARDYTLDQDGILHVEVSPNNHLFADCVVSFPAEPDSTVLSLVAEKLNMEDIMTDNTLISELAHDDIRGQLNDLINPNKDSDGYRIYDYWIMKVFNDYVVVSDEKLSGVYWKFIYTIENDVVTLGEKSQVSITYTTINSKGGTIMNENINIDVNEIVKEKDTLLLENGTLKTAISTHEATIGTLTAEKLELEGKLDEANKTIITMGKDNETLTAEVGELRTFKSEVIDAQNVAQIEAIVSDVKENLTAEELVALNEVVATKDVDKVQHLVNELCAKKYKESLKLTNEVNTTNFFAMPNQKTLGGDELAKFNM